jgi:hypothetical protein
LTDWINSQSFQIYTPLENDKVVLSFQDELPLLQAFAAEVNRFGCAAIESIHGQERSATLPKSTAWLAVRSYYAAFFAAHSLLRIMGISCTQIESAHARSITDIAALFQMDQGTALASGLYVSRVDCDKKTIELSKQETSGGGSHLVLWKIFYGELRRLSTELLSGSGASVQEQRTSAKLIELQNSLSAYGSRADGGWLSIARNRINYKLELGGWFPYKDWRDHHDRLFETVGDWKKDPMEIQIWRQSGRELQQLIETATLIVSMCRVACEDISARCPKGKSFQTYGVGALLNRLG